MTDWRSDVPARWAPLVGDFGPVHPAAEPHMVAMRDGVRLATDVYLPEPLRGRAPAILARTCYDKCGALMELPAVALRLAGEGYAVVVQDVRGRFRSEGEREPFFHELEDGYDTLEWIVAQPWSDGAVGMLGSSYLGFAQWAAAASGHPALKALSLAVTSQIVPTTWWGPSIAAPAGVEWLVAEWSCAARIESGVLEWARRPFADVVPEDLANPRRLLAQLRALDAERLQARAFPGGLPAAGLRIPALHAGGWWDLVNDWGMRDWSVVCARAPAASDQFLHMSATDHAGRRFGTDGETDLDATLQPSIELFDRYLRGRERAIPRVRYEIANGPWMRDEGWPPPGARPWVLHLADAGRATGSLLGGGLAETPDRAGTAAHWIHDPSSPVPWLGLELIHPLPHEAATHMRPDVATFTSEPVDREIDIVGPAVALLRIESSAPSTHVIATLLDLAPDGVVHQLLEGIVTVDTLHGPAWAAVDLGATAFRLEPGHRLRLAVASSRFPSYLPHPGTGESVWTAVETRPAEQWLRAGGSALRLSVMAPSRRRPAACP